MPGPTPPPATHSATLEDDLAKAHATAVHKRRKRLIRRAVAVGIVFAAIVVFAAFPRHSSNLPAPKHVTAAVTGSFGARALSPDFSGFSSAGDASDWADPRFIPALHSLHPESLRGYPSGTGSNYFNWETGQFYFSATGRNFITSQLPNPPDSLPLFLKAVKQTHSAAIFDINVMTYCPTDTSNPQNTDQAGAQCTPAQACGPQAFAYPDQCTNPDLTWGLPFELRLLQTAQQQGVPIKYVELGNEDYGTGDYEYYFPTVQRYIDKVNVWIAAIKQAFPGVKIAVVGYAGNDCQDKPNASAATLARWNGWTPAVLAGVRGEDALTFHTYYDSGISAPGSVRNARDLDTMLSTAAQSCIASVKTNTLSQLPPGIEAWFTEWNLGPTDRVLQYGSWAQGLTEATYALELARQPSVALIENESTINSQIYGALLSGASPRYANSTTNHRILVPTSPPPKVQPFAKSAGGTALGALNRSLQRATSTSTLEFAGAPTVRGTKAVGLLGQAFTVGGKQNLYFVNLSADPITLSLGPMAGRYSMLQCRTRPATFVVGANSVTTTTSAVTDEVTLPPYSVSSLVAN